MKKSELRVGNWLNWYSEYHCNLYFDKQLEIEDLTQTDLSSARPIQLTEEWLFRLPEDLVSEDIPSWINYVHQLQNWYFIEKGCKKELVFKNK